jgi:hypothetical protein
MVEAPGPAKGRQARQNHSQDVVLHPDSYRDQQITHDKIL